MEPIKLLAIDPGFGRLGFAIGLSNGKLINYDLIETPAWTVFESRLLTIYNALEAVLAVNSIDLIVYEEPGRLSGRNGFLLPQVLGVINLLVAQHKLKVIRYSPSEIKSMVTGKGGACKTLVEDKVVQKFNLTREEFKVRFGGAKDDVFDAVGVFLCYCLSNNILNSNEADSKNTVA